MKKSELIAEINKINKINTYGSIAEKDFLSCINLERLPHTVTIAGCDVNFLNKLSRINAIFLLYSNKMQVIPLSKLHHEGKEIYTELINVLLRNFEDEDE